MTDKKTGLELLREPFPAHQISKLPKPTVKREQYQQLPKGKCAVCGGYHATSNTIHLDYVGHAALTHRLLESDPAWFWEPLAFNDAGLPQFDVNGGLWIKLTVCGVTRLGYGNAPNKSFGDPGDREKEVIGDALRNAAMRFGAALDLWHKGDIPLTDDEPEQRPQQQPPQSNQAPPQTNQAQQPKPEYPDPQFQKNWDQWQQLVASGKKTPAAIVANIETKYSLSQQQKNQIMGMF